MGTPLVEEIGFVRPTDVQRQSLPVLLSGRDCVLHAQTGSGKTLAYLLLVFSIVDVQRLAVQALLFDELLEVSLEEDLVVLREPIIMGFNVRGEVEEIGFVRPTDVQRQSLPVLLSGRDCVLHAQTGSGKTLAYLLLVFSIVDVQRLAVQALIIVPTRELGMQVAKVARMLAAEPAERGMTHRPFTVMALLDGGMLKRHKSWLKAEPPQLVVATVGSLCRMLEKQFLKLETVQVLIIDEVDFMFNSSEQSYSLRKILTQYSTISNRQTVFASASIPQHRRFLYDCVQQKWTKSELSKRAGDPPSATRVIEFLKTSYVGHLDVLLLEDDMNFNARVNALLEVRQRGCLLVATDIAGRGIDLPEMTHIYNYDLPRTATDYLHRAGRTARMPFSGEICCVTSIITPQERFVLQRFENELKFRCEVVHHPRKS
ncbi:hypothetical protein QJS04_geneDACA004981 [Acorus gramineus]|uniref:RNA helicase n=1 Tax=Acorus gramineus TaxID=55184 RepID=A0AAV9BSB8_ACOGR|nr:hypothetical protein QJS04_geneDACA004981 [Acorus gramineus]